MKEPLEAEDRILSKSVHKKRIYICYENQFFEKPEQGMVEKIVSHILPEKVINIDEKNDFKLAEIILEDLKTDDQILCITSLKLLMFRRNLVGQVDF